jgi:hypothetical protein
MKLIYMTRVTLLFTVLACLAVTSCKKLDFTKTEVPPPPGDEWLFYDNGSNYTGVSANSGGNFDIAMRFNPSQLSDYNGFQIAEVKFYPLTGYPATYSVTLWKGTEPPTLIKVQAASVVSGSWNSVYLDELLYVDATQDLWVGIWIQDYPSGTYPAGCDAGPAVAGKGDLYSIDDGVSWSSLYNADGLNYNWNLEVFLVYPYGKKVMPGTETDPDPAAKQLKEALRLIQPLPANEKMISLK